MEVLTAALPKEGATRELTVGCMGVRGAGGCTFCSAAEAAGFWGAGRFFLAADLDRLMTAAAIKKSSRMPSMGRYLLSLGEAAWEMALRISVSETTFFIL